MPIITAMCCFRKILVLLQKLILVHFTIEIFCLEAICILESLFSYNFGIQIWLQKYKSCYLITIFNITDPNNVGIQICAKLFFLDVTNDNSMCIYWKRVFVCIQTYILYRQSATNYQGFKFVLLDHILGGSITSPLRMPYFNTTTIFDENNIAVLFAFDILLHLENLYM